MKKPPSLLSWVLVFGAGFLAGIVFSAWKLESLEKAARPSSEERQIAAKGNVQGRITDLEKAVAANPESLRDLILLGNEYFDTGRHEKAVETYQKALRLDPRNADVVTDMGVSYRKLGQPEGAVAAFRRALEIDPNHIIALFNLGIVYRDDLKNPEEALKAWEAFLQKAPDAPHAVMVRPWVNQLQQKLWSGGSEGK
jgi:cytochrome c-type biogenesis protein CcmH/NrfG